MPRKAILVVLMILFAAGSSDAGMPFRRRSNSGGDAKEEGGKSKSKGKSKGAKGGGGMFPGEGDVDDLSPNGKVLTYKNDKFQELYGSAGNRYIQYGMRSMMSADYTYGAPNQRVSIEIAIMETPTAAAGLFHHHRGKVLQSKGTPMGVGAEGVLDSGRGNRNLYFYRSNLFVKLVYSGKEPVPSLMPIAAYIDSHLPADRDAKPEGFDLITIDGVDPETISLTPGFTFNISFLPASVTASAPGGGSPASDLFIITRRTYKEAMELYKDYLAYLKLHAEYVEEYNNGGLKMVKATDPNQGRVLFAAYKHVFILAARPDGYEKGEVLIDRVITKIEGEDDSHVVSSSSDDEDDDPDGEDDDGETKEAPKKRQGFRKRK